MKAGPVARQCIHCKKALEEIEKTTGT